MPEALTKQEKAAIMAPTVTGRKTMDELAALYDAAESGELRLSGTPVFIGGFCECLNRR